MKQLRKISRKYYLRQIVACWMMFAMLLSLTPVRIAMANTSPDSGALPSGLIDSVGVDAPGVIGSAMSINQTANEAIMNWNNFDIGSSASVTFIQSSSMAVLNRVHDGVGTGIMGSLNANGRVFIINPAGIVFGPGATINVSQLVASSLDIADDDFLNGAPYQFINGSAATGEVTFNAHYYNVAAERLFLIGKNVLNKGGLVANDFVVMAAGDSVLISEPDSSVAVVVDMGGLDPEGFTVVNKNEGGDGVLTKIEAEHIILAAGDIWSAALVKAYSETGSDAVATVDITAVGGNVLIEDDVIAEAVGNGDGLDPLDTDNAIATINIIATDNPEDSVDGGNVLVKSGFGRHGDTEVRATARDSFNNNTATVNIKADGDVDVAANYKDAKVIAEAYNWLDLVESPAEPLDGLVNTATVDITARSVEVRGTSGGTAAIEALAYNELTASALGNSAEEPLVVTLGDVKNEADVLITTKVDDDGDPINEDGPVADNGDVLVVATSGKCGPGEAYISAEAYNEVTAKAKKGSRCSSQYGNTLVNLIVDGPVENYADVLINAADDAIVIADCKVPSDARIEAEAYNSFRADGTVKYCPSYQEYAAALNVAGDGTLDNYAGVDITTGDDVIVLGDGGVATINAEAYNEEWEDDDDQSDVDMESYEGIANNTADTTIDAGGDVLVHGINGDGYIKATAYNGTNNSADVSVDADGDVEVKAAGCEAAIIAEAYDAYGYWVYDDLLGEDVYNPGENSATVILGTLDTGTRQRIGGDVLVTAEQGEAKIEALSYWGDKNTSNVLVCTDGAVEVTAISPDEGGVYKYASIGAIAHCGTENTASVGIGAVEGVLVKAANGGYAEILAKTEWGSTNTAKTIVCTKGDLWVVGAGCYAQIASEALWGYTTDAYTGVCAEGDIWVAAGFNPEDIIEGKPLEGGMGGEAVISSKAEGYEPVEPSTATARTVAVSKKGSVIVAEITGEGVPPPDTAGIVADAHDAYINTASVGVAAGADLSPADLAALPEDGYGPPPGGVYVFASGPGSDARIMSHAYNGYENTAETVVCAPGEVVVEAYGYRSLAKIKSWAENGELNHATTQVYASDVYVDVPNFNRGNGIQAKAGSDAVHPEFTHYCFTDDGALALTNGGAVLIIDSYANAKGCPECPPCPCEEVAPGPTPPGLIAPVAPLPPYHIPRIEGCPELTLSAAAELGIPSETLQVAIGNALALNPSIQSCQACATLVNAASILKDVDGSRMAAMVQVFNATAPADAPYTPEMATSIAMAFENAAEGSQYASAMEFIDAFVQYVAALDSLGSPVGDSTAFVMGKYGAGLSENNNMATFIAGRIAEGQTF